LAKMASKLKKILKRPEIIVAPGAPNPLTGKIVEMMGFKCAYMGGYMSGAQWCTTEPLTTCTEFADWARYITAVINIPLIVDGDAGYGDAVHTHRAVRLYELAGIAAMHIEDQVFPKRASYHKGIEHIISGEEMISKINVAIDSREDMLIIARTDAIRAVGVESLDEAIRRLNLYMDAGADMGMPIGVSTMEQVKRIPEEVDAPLVYVSGDPFGLKLTPKELERYGWKIVIYSFAPIAAAYGGPGIIPAYQNLKNTGRTGMDEEKMVPVRRLVEEAEGLPFYYEIEEKTTEMKTN